MKPRPYSKELEIKEMNDLPKTICLQRREAGSKRWLPVARYRLEKITNWDKWTIHKLSYNSYGVGLIYRRVPAIGHDFWDSLTLARALTLEETKREMLTILDDYASRKDIRLYFPAPPIKRLKDE